MNASLCWGAIFDISKEESRLREIELEAAAPEFWNNAEKAQAILKERSDITGKIDKVSSLQSGIAK